MTSRPSRARGLKQRGVAACGIQHKVAPLAGAWIETRVNQTIVRQSLVAPLAGAWIETIRPADSPAQAASRPSRARGLKHL